MKESQILCVAILYINMLHFLQQRVKMQFPPWSIDVVAGGGGPVCRSQCAGAQCAWLGRECTVGHLADASHDAPDRAAWHQPASQMPVTMPQIAKFIGPTWGPSGSCQPQLGTMLAPWTLLSGALSESGRYDAFHRYHRSSLTLHTSSQTQYCAPNGHWHALVTFFCYVVFISCRHRWM